MTATRWSVATRSLSFLVPSAQPSWISEIVSQPPENSP